MSVASRKTRREVPVAPESLERWDASGWADESESAERTRRHAELVELLRRLVETQLTETQRRTVELYFFEGHSQEQIAAELGISQQSVSRHLFGAVRDGQKVGGAIRRLQRVLAELGIEWV